MRAGLLVVVGSLTVIADVAYQCADRVRGSGGAAESVEEWAVATFLAVAVGLAGAGWAAAAAVPAGRRVGRLTRPVARYGAGAALVCGLGAMAAAGMGALVAGSGPGWFWRHRYELEALWLLGAALGGLVGSGVGAGLGAAAYGSRRPAGTAATDPEREDYREESARPAVDGLSAAPDAVR